MPVLNEPPVGRRGTAVAAGKINPAVLCSATSYARQVATTVTAGRLPDPDVCRLVAAHPALGALPEHEQGALLRWSRLRPLKRQEVIFRQGDPASSVALVLDGFVKLSVPLADGGELFLDIAGAGSCIGEMPALHGRPHSADVIALASGRLLMIDARIFRQTFDRTPEGLLALLRLANQRLQRMTEQLMDNRGRAAPARLAKTVLQLVGLGSSDPHRPGGPALRLSQGELGRMAGMSRELVNKHLGAWRDVGWIRMSGGTVASVDIAALKAMSGDDEEHDGGAR